MKKTITALTLLLLMMSSVAFAARPVIKADTTYFDPGNGVYVLRGNVNIETGRRIFTASQARVSLGSFEVWGAGGVTLSDDDTYFVGERVYVYGKNRIARIDGGLHFSRANIDIIADQAEYNWKTKVAVFSGNVQITQDGTTIATDSAAYHFKTNSLL